MSKKSKYSENNINYYGYRDGENRVNDVRCDYCTKYYDEKLFLGKLDYCINCWSVINNDSFDCEKLTYDSDDISIDIVISFLKRHYNEYINNGPNKEIEECIFNKIKKAIENNKLHFLLKRELIKDVKKFVNLDNYKQFTKNRNPKVDYNLSTIII